MSSPLQRALPDSAVALAPRGLRLAHVLPVFDHYKNAKLYSGRPPAGRKHSAAFTKLTFVGYSSLFSLSQHLACGSHACARQNTAINAFARGYSS